MNSLTSATDNLPRNEEAERALLGSMILAQSAVEAALERLVSSDFFLPRHQVIFEAMTKLAAQGWAVDVVTLAETLQREGKLTMAGNLAYLAELSMVTPTPANAEKYIAIVEERSIMRRLAHAGCDITQDAMDGAKPLEQMLDDAERVVYNISMGKKQDTLVHIKDTLIESYDHIGELIKHKGTIVGVPTGFTDLDEMTSGLQKSDLVIIAGRPSMGKTAFALNLAQNAAEKGATVCVFSLEMSAEQLVKRMLCAEAAVDMQHVNSGSVDDNELLRIADALPSLSGCNIYIDDNAAAGVAGIRSKCRRLQSREGLDLVIIDYLQLMQTTGKSDNRVLEISEITRSLKIMARELNIPIILLSQLSRGPEARKDHRPMMADLRESGAIEQDADLIMMLYRPAVYGESDDNDTELIIAKHRNGPTGTVHLAWIDNVAKFTNATNREEY